MNLKKAENSAEYKKFKKTSDEDAVLIKNLSRRLRVPRHAKVLDIGGREGYISLGVAPEAEITIVENDPDVAAPEAPVHYVRQSIQDTAFDRESFDVILLSHVLGVLGRQGVHAEIVERAYAWLKPGGSLVLFYNTNSGYMGELLEFARAHLKNLRYDYFDGAILESLESAEISSEKVVTPISYDSFEELGRACWYLFNACDGEADDEHREYAAGIFLPKLKRDLASPMFDIEQSISIVTKGK